MTKPQLENLLDDLSLDEKVGQLVQVTAALLGYESTITGPQEGLGLSEADQANIGSVLAASGAERLIKIQDAQMARQPHHIPVAFMCDVINGYETIFPIPLGLGATFDPSLAEAAARIAAVEAAAAGVDVTFSPMLDTVRDARWGRVMESPGEDPYLNSFIGVAMVRGYQGEDNDIGTQGHVASTVKHFAAYGAPDGGRDYDNVELSPRTLLEDYLPAYKAAVMSGARLVMSSFNTLDRIPSSGNKWLMKDVLRGEWGFKGVLISDYGAIEEMVNHGLGDCRQVAKRAMDVTMDIDMYSHAYNFYLKELVQSGEISLEQLDEAVMRVLELKNDLGLFENPYKDASVEREKEVILCREHREAACEIAKKSFVLLENDGTLPLSKSDGRIAFIGPYVDNHDIHGSWSHPRHPEASTSIKEAVLQAGIDAEFAIGSYVMDPDMPVRNEEPLPYDEAQALKWLDEAVEIAKHADTVVMCLGEHRDQSGECASRTELQIPHCQQKLLEQVASVNANIVIVLFSGRPLETKKITKYAKALLLVWFPGTEGGTAITDVLFGESEPGGRLPMTFPRTVAQEPIYYNHLNTGRPNPTGDNHVFVNSYMDESTLPQYPFGYGLTYTSFEYSPVAISGNRVSAVVTNTGSRTGTETVQLYIHDVAATVARPVKELKGFKKVTLEPGESRTVAFEIEEEMLEFYNIDMRYVAEPGEFEFFIGPDSSTQNKAECTAYCSTNH